METGSRRAKLFQMMRLIGSRKEIQELEMLRRADDEWGGDYSGRVRADEWY